MFFRHRGILLSFVAVLLASPAGAQQFGIGATYGWVNDVTHDWALDGFHNYAWEAWFESKLEDNVVTRLNVGALQVAGSNVGQPIGAGAPLPVMPSYNDQIGYVTVDVSYLLLKGPVTSGLFAGIGGYKLTPKDVPAGFQPYEDPRQTVFGWNAGVDGSVHLYRGLALVGRVTFHDVMTESRRYLLVASVGAMYRF